MSDSTNSQNKKHKKNHQTDKAAKRAESAQNLNTEPGKTSMPEQPKQPSNEQSTKPAATENTPMTQNKTKDDVNTEKTASTIHPADAKKEPQKKDEKATPVTSEKEAPKQKDDMKAEKKAEPQVARSTPPSSPSTNDKKAGLATTLSIISMVMVVALGAGLYYHGHSQGNLQKATIAALQSEVDSLKPQLQTVQSDYNKLLSAQKGDGLTEQLAAQQQQLKAQFTEQAQIITTLRNDTTAQLSQFKSLQSKVSALSTKDANLWLLAEADFLAKHAARKLNSEKDILTAVALLSSADASIREMNDPSLHGIRVALQKDIATLAAIKHVDIDGTVIKLHQLADQLDQMPLIRNQLEDSAPVEEENLDVSESIDDWKQNITKSWKSFVSDFVTVTPIETKKISSENKPELTPNQGAFLRENIRLQLLIAAQAVPNYQNETYQQALAKVTDWIKEYYDLNQPINKAALDELAQLQQLNINVEIPDSLDSQPMLNRLVETRLRGLIMDNGTVTAKAAEMGE